MVRAEFTDPAATDTLYNIMKEVGRMPVRVNRDVPGFLANRIQTPSCGKFSLASTRDWVRPRDVDRAVRYGFGFRYVAGGPILQKEFAGLETNLSAARTIYPSLCNSSEPSRVLSQAVAEGRLGMKTGRGFWQWTPGQIEEEQARYERTLMAALKLLLASKAVTERD